MRAFQFLDQARRVISLWEEAEDAARGLDSLKGAIRLALPVMYGTRAVIPHLAAFMSVHPEVRIEILMSDERQNLVADGVDVAIRVGALDDSTFGSRVLSSVDKIVAAAPTYLEKHGIPNTPADLAEHECILGHGGFGRGTWRFRRNNTVTSVNVQGRLRINAAPGLVAAIVAGFGIGMVSNIMADAEVRSGSLQRVLSDYKIEGVGVYAIFPAGPRPSAKVRALVDFLAKELNRGGRA